MDLLLEFEGLVRALAASGVQYAVCGGFAVNIHGHVRATRDIDVLVPGENVDRAIAVARGLGFTSDSGAIPFSAGTSQARELRRVSKIEGGELLTLDLVIVTPVLAEVWRGRTKAEWRGSEVPVVSLEGLELMKRLAGRTQDLADLESLGIDPARKR
jgi:hypothetical protein